MRAVARAVARGRCTTRDTRRTSTSARTRSGTRRAVAMAASTMPGTAAAVSAVATALLAGAFSARAKHLLLDLLLFLVEQVLEHGRYTTYETPCVKAPRFFCKQRRAADPITRFSKTMAKRPSDAAESVPPKRARQAQARRIGASAIAPSTSVPGQLDVDAAIKARTSEIITLFRAMKHAREATNTRAWQLLPRHLRRRAASHNLLRLPARLRWKASAELRASNTAAKTRSQMRRRMPERTLTGFVRRRNDLARRAGRTDRRWLETHLWHAKRFRMSIDKHAQDGGPGSFGFSLAESPHHKSFRRSVRYTSDTAMLHDASYTSVFRLTAQSSRKQPMQATRRLQLLLFLAGAAHGWEDVWTTGAKVCDTTLLQRPTGDRANHATALYLPPVAPIHVLWVRRSGAARECHVWVHPAAAAETHRLLQQALDAVRAEVRRGTPHKCPVEQRWDVPVKVEVTQLASAPDPALAAQAPNTRRGRVHGVQAATVRDDDGYNLFQVKGMAAGRVLGGVLRLADASSREEGAQQAFFRRIACLQDGVPPSYVERGTVVCVDVLDPRLSFPPKNAPGPSDEHTALPALVHDHTPVMTSARFFAYRQLPRHTKGAIDQRRARQLPGKRLAPEKDDDRVPIVLVATSDGPLDTAGYTLLVPRGWGLAFWHSLVYTGSRVLGQEQLRQQKLHAGQLSYPHDWVTSAAYAALETAAAAQRSASWHRRPPAKRVNFAEGESAAPHPFGGMARWRDALQHGAVDGPAPAQLTAVPVLASWPRLLAALQKAPGPDMYTRYVSLWTRHTYDGGVSRLPLAPAISTLCQSVVPVLLVACRRGAFHELATLHLPPTLEAAHAWRAALDPPTRLKDAARADLDALERAPPAPYVGAVTTGDYSLADGRGRAIGSMSLLAWLELERREEALRAAAAPKAWGLPKRNPVPLSYLVLVRNAQGGVVRAASARLVDT